MPANLRLVRVVQRHRTASLRWRPAHRPFYGRHFARSRLRAACSACSKWMTTAYAFPHVKERLLVQQFYLKMSKEGLFPCFQANAPPTDSGTCLSEIAGEGARI